LLFALHPVHVESVAWMTELKNTLSGVLYLLAAWAYLDFDERRRFGRYAAALVLFILAVLAKTVAVTLPAALLVVFWWQRGRIRWREDIIPLIPFFISGAALGVVVAWVERALDGAEGVDFQLTLVERCLVAGRAIWFYAAKLAWPSNLIFIYPRWNVSQTVWWQYLFPLAVVAVGAALWSIRAWSRGPLAAMLFFCGTLIPAIGFFNVYAFQYSFVADHFQYLATIGVFAATAGGFATLAHRWRVPTAARVTASVIVVSMLAVLSWRQSFVYRDVETLYRTTIAKNPECWMAENNLGSELVGRSRDLIPEAIAHFRRAIAINAAFAPAHDNLGRALMMTGKTGEALVEVTEAGRLQPRFLSPWISRGNILRELGRLDEAAASYEGAVRLKPSAVEARVNLAGVLLQLGRHQDAIVQLTEARRLDPGSPTVRANLAMAWSALAGELVSEGRASEALTPYQQALSIDPDSVDAHHGMAGALLKLGRADEAIPHLRETVRLMPDSATARANLANVLAMVEQARRDRAR
jgi:tetratricopeptide (TPR) repeat protein